MPALLVRALVLLALPSASQLVAAQALPPDFDGYVERAMKVFQVPGLSIAVVKDGKVVLAKGYGTSRLGTVAPVTSDTLFGIASNTKLFTATALALLVDEGKIKWNDRVQAHLPEFALSDPYVSHELTVMDLLVHRSGLGLGAGDLLWWPESTYSADEVVERLRYIPLATSFRNNYAYDNVLYLVAGKLIERVSGVPWEQFVAERILKKVGMTESRLTYAEGVKSGHASATHAFVDGKLQVIPPFTNRVTGPAGGIMSSATDMAKWLQVQLGNGKLEDGSQLFTPARSRELWTPVTIMPSTGKGPGVRGQIRSFFRAYALGLVVAEYRGRQFLSHNGSLPGYVSWVSMLPEEKLGIAILTNQESQEAFMSLAYRIQDHFLNANPEDWTTEFDTISKASKAAAAQEQPRNKASKPSLPLEQYAKAYRDKWYGDISIKKEGEKLVMRFSRTPALVGTLEHWQYDTFVVRWHDRSFRADAFLTFSLKPDGSIDSAKMAPFNGSVDFSFDFQDLLLIPVQ